VRPADAITVTNTLAPGSFVAELGMGVVHAAAGALVVAEVAPGVAAIAARVKQQFDPAGRLNPGVVVS
jgi:FAD/FMN-containing dehydrogenase